MSPFLQHYDQLTDATDIMHNMQQNRHNHAKLLHEFQFHIQPKICRKSAENKLATNPPQKYSAGRISAEKFQ